MCTSTHTQHIAHMIVHTHLCSTRTAADQRKKKKNVNTHARKRTQRMGCVCAASVCRRIVRTHMCMHATTTPTTTTTEKHAHTLTDDDDEHERTLFPTDRQPHATKSIHELNCVAAGRTARAQRTQTPYKMAGPNKVVCSHVLLANARCLLCCGAAPHNDDAG